MKGERLILGAGLSGLSASYHLGGDVAILEKEERPGGLCRSVEQSGYVFDYGPHILFSADPYASGLIRDLLGEDLLVKEREAYIHHDRHGCLTRFPFQAHLHGLPMEVVRDCLVGLFEAYCDPQGMPLRNYRDWIVRTFGAGIAEHLMIPYAEKLWTVPPEQMNFEWIERRVPTPPIRDIVAGALSEVTTKVGFNNTYWYPNRGGIEALVKGLCTGVHEIRCKAEVTAIDVRQRSVEINGEEWVSYDQLISTLPLPCVINLIREAPDEVKHAAQGLEHNSILVVNLGIRREGISAVHWCYFYEEPFCFHRISLPMNLSPNVVPPGCSSVSTEIAYSKHRPLAREGVVDRVVLGLIRAGILQESDEIEVTQMLDIHYAYIIYDHRHRRNVDTIHSYLAHNGIVPCGRFGEWEYFNMDHSILSGRRAAEKVRPSP